MLAKRVIPCLDVSGGRVVKGVNFKELRDAGDPVEALRLRPVRRYVVRRGRVIAKTEAPRTRLMINGNASDISRRFHD